MWANHEWNLSHSCRQMMSAPPSPQSSPSSKKMLASASSKRQRRKLQARVSSAARPKPASDPTKLWASMFQLTTLKVSPLLPPLRTALGLSESGSGCMRGRPAVSLRQMRRSWRRRLRYSRASSAACSPVMMSAQNAPGSSSVLALPEVLPPASPAAPALARGCMTARATTTASSVCSATPRRRSALRPRVTASRLAPSTRPPSTRRSIVVLVFFFLG
mmetsp:Transcript_21729/g.66486  ORF Transcript_21729/g.66486 Transcript_21729/m.66486 type:complete len:218 (+) Transcript_21729:1377-2030(+)